MKMMPGPLQVPLMGPCLRFSFDLRSDSGKSHRSHQGRSRRHKAVWYVGQGTQARHLWQEQPLL